MASIDPPVILEPDEGVVALLETMLEAAKKGVLTEVLVWFKCHDESVNYDFLCHDVPEMLFDLGTVILRERAAHKDPVPN